MVNEDPKDALLKQYQLELERLRKLLETGDGPRVPDWSPSGIADPHNEVYGDKKLEYEGQVEKLRKECENSNLSAQRLREELEILRSRYEGDRNLSNDPSSTLSPDVGDSKVVASIRHDLDERRRKKREAAKREVMKRLERLTIGGEARGDTEVRKRRERRRKRLEVLAEALEKSSQDGNGSAFEVYGQLRSTEDALKRMAKKAKQLEAEVADLQV